MSRTGDFYLSKGLMKRFLNLHEVAENMQVPLKDLQDTFASHKLYASGQEKDPFGKGEDFGFGFLFLR